MAERPALLAYTPRDTPLHRANGAAKLLATLAASIAAMVSFDTRLLVVVSILSVAAFVIARVRLRDLAIVLWLLVFFLVLNNVFIFLFAPQYGVALYGTRHDIVQLGGWTSLTLEQLFYQANVSLKYLAVTPIALVFFTTTSPSEFAASLNRLGVPARAAYSVSLALRFIPDVQREVRTVARAQQARGIDISSAAPFFTRVRNLSSVLLPVLLSNMARIETVASALELRGFDRSPRRTWWARRPLRAVDWWILSVSGLLVAAAVALLWVNGGRFFNPFR